VPSGFPKRLLIVKQGIGENTGTYCTSRALQAIKWRARTAGHGGWGGRRLQILVPDGNSLRWMMTARPPCLACSSCAY